ncbi:hypothetical protein PDG61_22055 [Mycolicibacterium sp. BiH015]|uniref:hypothetical protein n=1 Tax=Mycolicibacterium sp. BiH015 TaxID=3018808 RepID=UPI0022E5CEA2|nr:hypothetical protein [Mycolicibacterium sp. BiH015]MDA2893616.1 hypothetical protein [Mycolicibacterium sp. BiH015]
MKVEFSRKALQHYRWRTSPNGRGWHEVDDDAPVHAVLLNHPHRLSRYWTKDLRKQTTVEYLRKDESVPAVCGRSVRVVYPMAFDTSAEERLCQACTSMLDARQLMGEAEFWRQVDAGARRESLLEWQRRRKHLQNGNAVANPLLDAEVRDADPAAIPGGRLQELMAQEDVDEDDDGWRTAMFEGLLKKDSQQHPPEADDKGA